MEVVWAAAVRGATSDLDAARNELMLLMAEKARLASELAVDIRREEVGRGDEESMLWVRRLWILFHACRSRNNDDDIRPSSSTSSAAAAAAAAAAAGSSIITGPSLITQQQQQHHASIITSIFRF